MPPVADKVTFAVLSLLQVKVAYGMIGGFNVVGIGCTHAKST
mgnify:CR=1 FL=1